MKIALSTSGETLEAPLDSRFGRAGPCTVSVDILAWVETSLKPLYQLRS